MFSAIVAIDASSAAISAAPGPHVAQRFFQVIALHIHHHDVGQFQRLFRIGGDHRLLLLHAAGDQLFHLRILSLDRRFAAVEQWNLPETPRARRVARQ